MRWEVQSGQTNRVSFRKMKTAMPKMKPVKQRNNSLQQDSTGFEMFNICEEP